MTRRKQLPRCTLVALTLAASTALIIGPAPVAHAGA